jgi:hypothetical protein
MTLSAYEPPLMPLATERSDATTPCPASNANTPGKPTKARDRSMQKKLQTASYSSVGTAAGKA